MASAIDRPQFIAERIVAQAIADEAPLYPHKVRTLHQYLWSEAWSDSEYEESTEEDSVDDAGVDMHFADLIRRAYTQDVAVDSSAHERYRQDYLRLLQGDAYLASIVSEALGWTMNSLTLSGPGRVLKLAGLGFLLLPTGGLGLLFGMSFVGFALFAGGLPPAGRIFGALAGSGLCAGGVFLFRLWRREIKA
jgi:hypothetical protein